MSDLALPEPKLVIPPARERILVWTALASLVAHAGLLAIVLWSPLRDAMEAEPPQAIEVELVKPEEVEAPVPPPSEPTRGESTAGSPAAAESEAAASSETPQTLATPPAASVPEAAENAAAEPAASAAAPASTSAAAETPPAAEVPPTPPTPLARPQGEPAATAEAGRPSGPSGEPVAALEAETGEAEGASPDALTADPGVAALDLGDLRNAERFYLEAMLQQPGLARARDMLPTLPRDKRLSQTCNLEALAQIGNSGEGFAPDVVMTDAYARSVMTDTGLSASGGVFRSRDKWYGVAFDCTLSDDLSQVIAFSYRLGADVTDAVLARLEQR